MESIHINPQPIAPGLSNEGDYNLERAVDAILYGNVSDAPVERARSDEILKATNMGYSRRSDASGLAIPLSELRARRVEVPESTILATRVSTGAAVAQNAEEVVVDELVEFYRQDIPDPADILPLMTMIPGSPGDPRFVSVKTPDPAPQLEPGVVTSGVTAGYTETGDASAEDNSFGPTLLICRTSLTRLAEVRSPRLSDIIMSILMDKMDEVRNKEIIEAMMTATDATRYLDHMTKSAELTEAYTVANAHALTRQSWRYENVPGANRVAVLRPEAVDEMLGLAEPTAAGRLMTDGRNSVDGVPIIRTGHGARRQGFCGPMGLTRMKEWDGAVYVSSRYEAGIQWMLLELFWNWTLLPGAAAVSGASGAVGHPAEFYVFLDAA